MTYQVIIYKCRENTFPKVKKNVLNEMVISKKK